MLYAYALLSPAAPKEIAADIMKKGSRRNPPRPPATTAPFADNSESTALTPLNFKVPLGFHREFKTFAAQHGKKMVEVLQEAFASLKDRYGR